VAGAVVPGAPDVGEPVVAAGTAVASVFGVVVVTGADVELVDCSPDPPPLPVTTMSAHVGYVWLARSECQ